MTNPEDLTPPTLEPLSDEQRHAMRAELLAAVQRPPGAEHRWLMPGLAAAAVVAIVAVGAVVVGHGGDGPSGSTNPFAPAGQGGSSVQPTPAPLPEPTGHPHTSAPSVSAPGKHVIPRGSHVLPTKGLVDETTTCEQEIAALHRAGLDGATVTANRDYGDGKTSLYETKSDWIVCDTLASADGGAPTLFSPHQKDDAYRPDLSTLAVSENFSLDRAWFAQFVAAGRDFDGVQSISYAFPDGHTENAVVGETGMWSMLYVPTSGPLADPHVNQTTLDPVQVTVTYTGGATDRFTLEWGLDTCAQINHGC